MVGSDKERPKGRVGSGSDNARGSPILIQEIFDEMIVLVNDKNLFKSHVNLREARFTFTLPTFYLKFTHTKHLVFILLFVKPKHLQYFLIL